MNTRQRILAILNGEKPDRIPWIPRLELWYRAHKIAGDLPEKYQNWSLRQIEGDLDLGTPARDHHRTFPYGPNIPCLVGNSLFRVELHDVNIEVHQQDDSIQIEYQTPYGMVYTTQKVSKSLEKVGYQGLETEHMLKRVEDYPAIKFIVENTEFIPTYDVYMQWETEIGSDGLPLVYIGQDPMSRILQELIGYNHAYYHLHDFPDLVNELYEALWDQNERLGQVITASPATLILHGQHFDSQMTPPKIYQQYMLPYFQEFNLKMHEHGKYVACHADADTQNLLELIKASRFDMAECFVTAPMVSVTLEEAREVFDKQVIIWGGIPSIILCDPFSEQEFESYMIELFQTVAPGDAFILGVADNVTPEAQIDRIKYVSELVAQFGNYPVTNHIQTPIKNYLEE